MNIEPILTEDSVVWVNPESKEILMGMNRDRITVDERGRIYFAANEALIEFATRIVEIVDKIKLPGSLKHVMRI